MMFKVRSPQDKRLEILNLTNAYDKYCNKTNSDTSKNFDLDLEIDSEFLFPSCRMTQLENDPVLSKHCLIVEEAYLARQQNG